MGTRIPPPRALLITKSSLRTRRCVVLLYTKGNDGQLSRYGHFRAYTSITQVCVSDERPGRRFFCVRQPMQGTLTPRGNPDSFPVDMRPCRRSGLSSSLCEMTEIHRPLTTGSISTSNPDARAQSHDNGHLRDRAIWPSPPSDFRAQVCACSESELTVEADQRLHRARQQQVVVVSSIPC